MSDLRYPIGPYVPGLPPDVDERGRLLVDLAEVPNRIRAAVVDLSGRELDTPHRPGGWTVRQVVHHLADAQMNWYLRTKLALTEDEPLVKRYSEVQWADLPDARRAPVEMSLVLLDGLHQRWIQLFKGLTEEQWKRKMVHPDRGIFVIDAALPMHVWHGQHHTAQIMALRHRLGWM